jgi:hypothetical protein
LDDLDLAVAGAPESSADRIQEVLLWFLFVYTLL